MCGQAIGGDAYGLDGGLQRIFDHGFFLALADDDADGIVFVWELNLLIERHEVELHFAFVFGLEFTDFELHCDQPRNRS